MSIFQQFTQQTIDSLEKGETPFITFVYDKQNPDQPISYQFGDYKSGTVPINPPKSGNKHKTFAEMQYKPYKLQQIVDMFKLKQIQKKEEKQGE